MIEKINIEEFLALNEIPLIDVRSPAEFETGHIVGAFNIPLFNDHDRAIIGTLYKNSGRQTSVLKGLDLVGPYMSGFVRRALQLAPKKQLRIHCWRGGMRSESMAWLFSMVGFHVYLLEGGYKSFRNFIRTQLDQEAKYIVLSGSTGTGKTETLKEIQNLGYQMLDLEGLANHKGSAFGAIGEAPQPSNEHFENKIYDVWSRFDHSQTIWLEDESRSVGKVSVPEPLFRRMRLCPVVKLDMSAELRNKRLVIDYTSYPKDELIAAVERITRKLGGQNAKAVIEAIEKDDFETAIQIVLVYYDKTYSYGLSKRNTDTTHTIATNTTDAALNAKLVLDFCTKQNLI